MPTLGVFVLPPANHVCFPIFAMLMFPPESGNFGDWKMELEISHCAFCHTVCSGKTGMGEPEFA